MLENLTVVDHPLVQHKLTLLRQKEASTSDFRNLTREIALLLGYEVTKELPLTQKTIETPISGGLRRKSTETNSVRRGSAPTAWTNCAMLA